MKKLFLLFGVFFALQVQAAVPGEACNASGDVVLSGEYRLICNGSSWQQIEKVSTGGQSELRVGDNSAACDASMAGALRYNSNKLQYCNGSAWTDAGGGAAGSVRNLYSCPNLDGGWNDDGCIGQLTVSTSCSYKDSEGRNRSAGCSLVGAFMLQ